MAHTVIGMFDSATEAQQAVQQLVNSGILRDNIDISSASAGGYAGNSQDTGYDSANSGNSSLTSGSGTTTNTGYSDATAGSVDGYGDSTLESGLSGSSGFNESATGTGLSSGSTGYSDSTMGRLGDNYTRDTSSSETSYGRNSDKKESGITRFFKSLFGSDDDVVNTYSNVAQRSGSIVTVHAQSKDEAEIAADILDNNGAVNVDEKASEYGFGRSEYSDTDNVFTDSESTKATSIPVIEEQLEVGKRQVQTGGVRLRSRIVETPVEESLRLREEHVRVQRNTVDRPATEADFANFKETEIELTERAEVPVVSKHARVVEEISLDKEIDERKETIHDTVRNTEVDIENLENKKTGSGSTSSDSDWLDKKNNF